MIYQGTNNLRAALSRRKIRNAIEGGDDSHNHLIDPETFLKVAMAKQ